MAKTPNEQREYTRGYNRGRKRGGEWACKLLEIARVLRERAERAEKGLGLGHCADCVHWTRGALAYSWGYCQHKAEVAVEPWMSDDFDAKRPIVTSQSFGCVNFHKLAQEG